MPHLKLWDIKGLTHFWRGQRTKAGEGEMSRHTHASKKNGEFQHATGVGQRHCSHGT